MAHRHRRTHQKKSRDPQNDESKPVVFVGPKTLSFLNSTSAVPTPTFATQPANAFPSIFTAIYVGKPDFCGSLVLTNMDPRNDPQTFCKSKFRFHTRLPPPPPPPPSCFAQQLHALFQRFPSSSAFWKQLFDVFQIESCLKPARQHGFPGFKGTRKARPFEPIPKLSRKVGRVSSAAAWPSSLGFHSDALCLSEPWWQGSLFNSPIWWVKVAINESHDVDKDINRVSTIEYWFCYCHRDIFVTFHGPLKTLSSSNLFRWRPENNFEPVGQGLCSSTFQHVPRPGGCDLSWDFCSNEGTYINMLRPALLPQDATAAIAFSYSGLKFKWVMATSSFEKWCETLLPTFMHILTIGHLHRIMRVFFRSISPVSQQIAHRATRRIPNSKARWMSLCLILGGIAGWPNLGWKFPQPKTNCCNLAPHILLTSSRLKTAKTNRSKIIAKKNQEKNMSVFPWFSMVCLWLFASPLLRKTSMSWWLDLNPRCWVMSCEALYWATTLFNTYHTCRSARKSSLSGGVFLVVVDGFNLVL